VQNGLELARDLVLDADEVAFSDGLGPLVAEPDVLRLAAMLREAREREAGEPCTTDEVRSRPAAWCVMTAPRDSQL
jgi:hypothetical protein